MGEKAYKRYAERGPDALTLEETKAALEFRDTHPVAAGRIRAAVETRRREAQDKGGVAGRMARPGRRRAGLRAGVAEDEGRGRSRPPSRVGPGREGGGGPPHEERLLR